MLQKYVILVPKSKNYKKHFIDIVANIEEFQWFVELFAALRISLNICLGLFNIFIEESKLDSKIAEFV